LTRKHFVGVGTALAGLMLVYLLTLQTIPNGSDHYYMADVGETQVVLNIWGTLHATGYPFYVIIGNALVGGARALGVSPAAAPGLVSLVWGIAALALIYMLALHLTNRPLPSIAVTIAFGVTRTVWLHNVIAETYTMGLAILALLLLLALWQRDIPHRIAWLALVGGVGVAHHRLVILVAPAVLYAIWPQLTADRRPLPHILIVSLLAGLLGFLPYLYLPLRAQAGAAWVYDEPDTWSGFWDQFTGREAELYIGWPESPSALVANFNEITAVLVTELTIPGIVLGLLGSLLGVRNAQHRRAALTLLLSGLMAYVFHVVLWYTYPLPALTLPTTLSLTFGWLFLLDALMTNSNLRRYIRISLIPVTLLFCVALARANLSFIRGLTQNTIGLETIGLAENAPHGSTLMIDWGPRHFAVGFARDVMGELGHIRLVDHQADFAAIVTDGPLVTPEYTFYTRPVDWWEEQLGVRVYLRAVGPYLVQIDTSSERAQTMPSDSTLEEIQMWEQELRCTPDSLVLEVAWLAPTKPERNLSVFVHLLDRGKHVIAQADQFAPVYGWWPMTSWEAEEIVRDVYPLPRLSGAETVRYGLYQQLPSGEFQNESEFTLAVSCGAE
jgi:hypothetical protein